MNNIKVNLNKKDLRKRNETFVTKQRKRSRKRTHNLQKKTIR